MNDGQAPLRLPAWARALQLVTRVLLRFALLGRKTYRRRDRANVKIRAVATRSRRGNRVSSTVTR